MLKRTISLLLVLVMAVSMSACSGGVVSYRNELNGIIAEVEEINPKLEVTVSDIMNALNNGDADAYKEALDELEVLGAQLIAKYHEIADVKAPSEYENDQKMMQQYADVVEDTLEASMEMYRLMYDYTATGEMTEAMMDRIDELQNIVLDGSDATAKFDETLNRVMGYTED